MSFTGILFKKKVGIGPVIFRKATGVFDVCDQIVKKDFVLE